MINRVTPLLKFLGTSAIAVIIGTTALNGSIVQSAQATLTSVATAESQSITSASWKAVIGANSFSTDTGAYTVTQSTPSGDIMDSGTGGGGNTETTVCSSNGKKIYFSSLSITISVGMSVYDGSVEIGVIESIDEDYSSRSCKEANFEVWLDSPVDVGVGVTLGFGDGGGPQVIGHIYYKVVSLNNIGSHYIAAATITHTNPDTVLELCSGSYSGDVCNGTASTISPGNSTAISLSVGSSASLKVTLSVEDLVTTLSDTLSVAVSSSQIGAGVDTNS